MGTVLFCGSRSLPAGESPQVARVVKAVAAAGHTIVTGCAIGGDAQVIQACLSQGLASRLVIMCAFGSDGSGSWKGSAVGLVQQAAHAGANVQWWAGGGPGFQLIPRLKQRTAYAVEYVATSQGQKGVVAFVADTVSPGTWLTVQQAIEHSIPVVVFQSARLTRNLRQFTGGAWLPAGSGVWASGWKWFPLHNGGQLYTPKEAIAEVKRHMEKPAEEGAKGSDYATYTHDFRVAERRLIHPAGRHEWRVADGFHSPVIHAWDYPALYAPVIPEEGSRSQERPATYSSSPAGQSGLAPYASIAHAFLQDQATESLIALPLNESGTVATMLPLAQGDAKGLTFNLAQVIAELAWTGCREFIIAHNHTTGWSYPSNLDRETTRVIAEEAAKAGMVLKAHLVIANHKTGWTWSPVRPLQGSPQPVDNCRLAAPSPAEEAALKGIAAALAHVPELQHAITAYGQAWADGVSPWARPLDQSPFYILGQLEGELKCLRAVILASPVVREQRAEYFVAAECNAYDVARLLEAAIYAWRLIRGLPKDQDKDPLNYYTNWYVENKLVEALAPFEKPLVKEQPALYTVPANARPQWAQEWLLQPTPTPGSFTFEEPPAETLLRPRAMVRVSRGWAYATNLQPSDYVSKVYKADLGDDPSCVYMRGQDGLGSFQRVIYVGQYHPWCGLCEGLEVKLYDGGQAKGVNSLFVSISYVHKTNHDVVIDVYSGTVPLSPDTLTLAQTWFALMEKTQEDTTGYGDYFPLAAVKGAPEYRQALFVMDRRAGYQPDFSVLAPDVFTPATPQERRKPLAAKMDWPTHGRPYSVPIYQTILLKDKNMWVEEVTVRSPRDAAQVAYDYLRNADQEELIVLVLNSRNRIIGVVPVYRGNVGTTIIRLSEVFRPAIVMGAVAIIVCHNHPSGDPTPSPEDIKVTQQFYGAGRALDIDVLDHIIVGDTGMSGLMRFYSIKEGSHPCFSMAQ